ncbi:MAG: hypothetical protein ACAI38_14250 [Myxococcota bacterium]
MVAARVALFVAQLVVGQPQLELRIDSCADVNVAEVGRVVSVELRAAIVAGSAAGDTTTQVSVGCRGPFYQVRVNEPESQEVVVDTVVQRGYLELRVDDPITGKTLQRLIDVKNEPDAARSRLIGIAIGELVRASWIELLANPSPRVKPVEKTTTPSLQRAVVERARPSLSTSIAPECGATFYGAATGQTMWGCGLGMRASAALWHLSAEADVGAGERDVAMGRIDTTVASGFAAGGAHLTLGPTVLAAELGGRIGFMSIAGDAAPLLPVVGGGLRGAWGGPAARLSVDVVLTSWLGVRTSAEVGYAVLGPRGTALDEVVTDSQGLWLRPAVHLVVGLP